MESIDLYLYPVAIGLLLLAILIFTLWVYKRKDRPMLPPGPWYIPIIGNAWELKVDQDLRKSLRRLNKQYGGIYSLHMGPKLAVVISGYDNIREVFIKRGPEFADRPVSLFSTLIAENQGIVAANGELWKEHRKFFISAVRNFGSGKYNLEGKIHTEITILLSEITKQNEKPFCIHQLVQTSVSNVINSLVFGGQFKHEDANFEKVISLLGESLKNIGPNNVVDSFPFLQYLPGDLFGVKKSLRNIQSIERFIGGLIDKHIENYDEGKIEDIIDVFLQEMNYYDDQPNSTYTKKQLSKTVLDMFSAGTEPITLTITWAILYLAAKQDIQERVLREVNEIVGTKRLPSLHEKRKLLYTEAFIFEILRVCNIVTISLPHTCSVNTTIRGFDIPKGTILLPDIDSVHFDRKIWGDPENFRPERFISDGRILLKPDELITFFTGRRNCVGEALARMELCLFIPALVQRFEFLPREGTTLNLNDIDGVFGVTHTLKPFEIRAVVRNKEAEEVKTC